jgi:O-antigen/teichoic acid export membrane protein
MKFANVFGPTASAYETKGDIRELRELLITGGRYALYLSLPVVITLAITGRYFLRLWMGDRYDSGAVLAILALGSLPTLFQLTSMEIVRGMNRHGVPSLAFLAFAAIGIPIAALVLGYLHWGIVGGAVAAVIPQALLYGVFIPAYACRLVGLPVRQYLVETLPSPFVANVPLVLCLLASHTLWPDSVGANLVGGLGAGTVVLGVIYWHRVLPERIKMRVLRLAGLRGSVA